MQKFKDFVSTGIPPDGRLFAEDLDTLQDLVAAIDDLTQALRVGSVAVGESGLILSRYGSGEARISGALRTDGVVRGLGGLLAGSFTTTQRNAISSPPAGLVILNTTTGRYEWNAGTSGSPNWTPVGSLTTSQTGLLTNRPAANAVAAGSSYYATDQDVQYISDGSSWYRSGGGQPGDLVVTLNDAAATGRVLCQGQAWPSTSGIYADLYAKWGGSTLPDLRARMPVVKGTHSDVDTIGKNEGSAVGNRRPKHPHSFSLAVPMSNPGANNLDQGFAGNGVQGTGSTSVTGTIGAAGTADDSPAYYVVNVEAKL